MKTQHRLVSIDDFEVHTLVSEEAEVSVIPELGGKVVSIRHRPSGREWLDGWEPAAQRRLWRPTDPEDFETSTGSGIDECLPTVLPCEVDDRSIPDHGEVWSSRPEVHVPASSQPQITCRWSLKSQPLDFERRITLDGHAIEFHYQLKNRSGQRLPFLWAWHPLFSLQTGDQLTAEPPIDRCMTTDGALHPWPAFQPGQDLSRAETGSADPACAKVFVGPSQHRTFRIAGSSAVLELQWDMHDFPWAGIWITRGAWKGLHHWAIEPTNAPVDHLSDLNSDHHRAHLEPREVRKWKISLRLGKNGE